MDYPWLVILTPFNYHKWKCEAIILLWSKGICRIAMGHEVEPNYTMEK
jgi:hypothetical protein